MQAEDGRLTLETIGGLDGDKLPGAHRIYGKCLQGSVTLVDAAWRGSSGAYISLRRDKPDSVSERWEATVALIGRHVPESQTFTGVTIESYWADGWADIPYWRNGPYTDGILLSFAEDRHAEIQQAEFDGGSACISVGHSQQNGSRAWSITRNTRLDRTEMHPLRLAIALRT